MSIFASVEPIRYEGPDTPQRSRLPRVRRASASCSARRWRTGCAPAVCYWHSFSWPGADIFGAGTLPRPWLAAASSTQEMAEQKTEAAFDFIEPPGRAVLHVPRRRRDGRRPHTLEEHDANLRAHRGADRRARCRTPAYGCCGARRTSSAIRASRRRGHQPGSRSVRLGRRAGAHDASRPTHRLGGENYVCGAGARATTRCSTRI